MLLFLNDVDGYEVLVIVLVILIFFGPKSIPGIAKSLGRALYSFRNASSELQNEIKKSGMDIKKDLKFDDILKKEEVEITQAADQIFTDINHTVHYENKPDLHLDSQPQAIETTIDESTEVKKKTPTKTKIKSEKK